MKRSLVSSLNLENDSVVAMSPEAVDTAVVEATEAVTDVVESEQQAEIAEGEVIQLESALIHICNLEDAAEALVEAGTDEKVVAETLAPVAIEAIGQVDEDLADETHEEAVVALEADDAKGVWVKIKEKAVQIWEAIKKAVQRFWAWLKDLFDRKKAAAKKIQAAAEGMLKNVESRTGEWKTSEVAQKDSWTVGGKATTAADIQKAVEALAKSDSPAEKTFNQMQTKMNVLIASLTNSKPDGSVVEEAEKFLKEMSEKDSTAKKAALAFAASNGVGITSSEGSIKAAKAPEGAKMTTADQNTTKGILRGVIATAKAMVNASAAEDKMMENLGKSYKSFDEQAAKIKENEELAKFSNRVKVFRDVVSAATKAAKGDYNPVMLKSSGNALSFAKASLDAA